MALDFGDVSLGDSASQVLRILNTGEEALHIGNVEIKDSAAPFEWSDLGAMIVTPGQETEVKVTFGPLTGDRAEAVLQIMSDDPDRPVAEVPLAGQGIAPMIRVSPSVYDFGTVFVGCEYPLELEVTNTGNRTLTVFGMSFESSSPDLVFDGLDPAFAHLVAQDGSILLDPLEPIILDIRYTPIASGAVAGTLTISSDDPVLPEFQAVQQGLAEPFATVTDTFVQPAHGTTDILFALDRSGSMVEVLPQIVDGIAAFPALLSALGIDFRLAVTVEDNGCINGPPVWVDNTFSASDADTVIRQMADLGGSYGSNSTRAFMLLESALNETDPGDCNEGLLRSEASLHLLGVSNVREQSANTWSYYASYFQSLKDDPDEVVFDAIGGDMPSGCGDFEPYEGAYEAAVATGGQFISICTKDWPTAWQSLAGTMVSEENRYPLSATPIPETLVVTVDGIESTGWAYDPNAVEFDADHIPSAGSIIEISYLESGGCPIKAD